MRWKTLGGCRSEQAAERTKGQRSMSKSDRHNVGANTTSTREVSIPLCHGKNIPTVGCGNAADVKVGERHERHGGGLLVGGGGRAMSLTEHHDRRRVRRKCGPGSTIRSRPRQTRRTAASALPETASMWSSRCRVTCSGNTIPA